MNDTGWPAITYLLIITIAILTREAMPIVYRKAYSDESLPLTCSGCHSDIDECSIRINGINTSAGTTLQNGNLILRSRDWGVYGTVCCGGIDQQSCYKICSQYTEICEDCLVLSANVTAATVGDVIMISSSITQQPHNGISLLVNGSISRNSNFECRTTSHVLGRQVLFYCNARKSGTVTIQSNVVFCDVDLTSQQINITVEEQRTELPVTIPVSSTTPTTATPPSTTTTTPTVAADNTNNTVSTNVTAPSVPNDYTKDSAATKATTTYTIATTIILIVLATQP